VIEALDLETLEYNPSGKVDFEILGTAKKESDLGGRLRVLMESDDVVGKFAWGLLSNTLCYAAEMVPEISDEIAGVDNAMKWGYNWEKGPFELWDAVGVQYISERLKNEKREVPALVKAVLKTKSGSFYGFEKDKAVSYDAAAKAHVAMPQRARVIDLRQVKLAGGVIKEGKTASIVDIGEGIICVEFHSKSNAICSEAIAMIKIAVEEAEKNYCGLVIGNQGGNFCLGADLNEIAGFVEGGDYGALEDFINNLQSAVMALKYCHVPTVAAIHRMVLGGGCEVAMHCDRRQASPETYLGLVELGVGLIPAGGGSKEWAIRCSDWVKGLGGVNVFGKLNNVVEMIGMARVSGSAADARKMGYLKQGDSITMNRDSLIYGARETAIRLAEEGYRPPLMNDSIRVMGVSGVAEFKVRMNMFREGNFISEYDEFLTNKLCFVICGGDVPDNSMVSEQYLLDLEREAFVSLMKEEKTQERIKHMLKTRKPLRN
jgi:3-hydroxyacyl-CoA dehydrogenase